MADMLAAGASWLADQMATSAAMTCAYKRGANTTQFTATLGKSMFEAAGQNGVVERWEPPTTWDVVRDDHRTRALAEIGKAERQGDPLRCSDQSARWIGHVLRDALPDLSASVEAPRWRVMVRDMTSAWVSAGLIERVEIASGTRGRTSPAWQLKAPK